MLEALAVALRFIHLSYFKPRRIVIMAHKTAAPNAISAEELEQDIDRSSGAQVDLVRLYRLWEENNWSAYDIDFTQDALDWREKLTPLQRRAAHWNYALFLHGEEAVARTLAPF